MIKKDNTVRLCGRIVNRYDRGHVITLTLRITETVRNEQKVNYPRVYFFREDNTGADKFFFRDEVVITAHVATPRKYRNTGEEYISQALVGDSIAPRKGMYELLNIEGMGRGPLEPNTNTVVFSGNLMSIRKTGDKSAQVVVETLNDHRYRNDIMANIASSDVFNFRIGSPVSITGKVVTGYYEEDERGRRRYPDPDKAKEEKKTEKEKEAENAKNTETTEILDEPKDKPKEKQWKRVYYQHILGLNIKPAEEQ